MGNSISVHRGTFGAGGWLWYIGGLLVAAGALGLVRMQWGTGLASLAIGLACLVIPVLRWRQTLEIFENGFVWTRLLGTVSKQRGEIRTTQLIEHRSKSGVRIELVVTLVDGHELSITGLENAQQAANLVAQLAHAAPASGAGRAPPVDAGTSTQPSGGWQPPGTGGAA